jgi:transcriptional regulator with XRE-family HTH domain
MRKVSPQRDPRTSGGQHLGRAIRGLRRDRGLTLNQLSEGSGLSVPFLSQLENNRAKPSMQSLSAIAMALGCKMIDIMTTAEAGSVVDVDRAPAAQGELDRSLGVLGRQVHVEELTRRAGSGEGWQTHVHAMVLYVVRGAISVSLVAAGEESTQLLGAGDRILCGGGVAYRWEARPPDEQGDGFAVVVAVRVDDRAVLARD